MGNTIFFFFHFSLSFLLFTFYFLFVCFNSNMFFAKFKYGDASYMLSVDDSSGINRFRYFTMQKFNLTYPEFTLKYDDGSGDLITLSDDDDFFIMKKLIQKYEKDMVDVHVITKKTEEKKEKEKEETRNNNS